jgi:hypothetical protein
LAVSWCCGKDLGIITECGPLAISFRVEAHSFLCFAGMMKQRRACLGITGGMRSTLTSDLEVMLPPLHLFIKQETRQAANRLLGNGCSYVPNFWHSEVLIKMTDETPLLLAPRDKFVTLNLFDWKFTVDFPTRED